MNDISKNIKRVLIVFLMCFIGLCAYIGYFEMFKAPQLAASPYNKRLWAIRNEVLRGTIYDKNMKPLTKSTRINMESQKIEYIDGPLFAHVLGYADVKYGITGLQFKFDKELMSTSIKDKIASMFSLNKNKDTDEKVGNGLLTTLDYDTQKKAFDMLGNNRGAVVAINPKTGEILALVSKPSFDPNKLDEEWSNINNNKDKPLVNRATAGLYPPGSTFKTITAISALENIPNIQLKSFEDKGKISFNDKESLSNFNGEVFGNINFKDAYVHSSNVVFGTIGMELGNNNLNKTAEKFFFNNNIPNDGIIIENSRFPSLKKYEVGNIAQSAIGQSSVLATPMEMAIVASTIANNGVLMKPHIVKDIVNSKKESIRTINSEQIGQIISTNTAQIMKDYMREVVTKGTGMGASINGIEVCGKTGTAEHSDEGKGAPAHSWFIAFAPYKDPQIAVAVIVEDGGQGGGAAANIAREVIRTALK